MAETINEFADICPYTDEQARKAFAALAESPLALNLSQMLFPDKEQTFLKSVLLNIQTVDEFQKVVPLLSRNHHRGVVLIKFLRLFIQDANALILDA